MQYSCQSSCHLNSSTTDVLFSFLSAYKPVNGALPVAVIFLVHIFNTLLLFLSRRRVDGALP